MSTSTRIATAEIARVALKSLVKALVDDDKTYEARAMLLALETAEEIISQARDEVATEASPLRVPYGVSALNITSGAPPVGGVASSSGHFAAGAMVAGDLSVEEGIDVGQREDTLRRVKAHEVAFEGMLQKAQDLPSRTGASGGSGYSNVRKMGLLEDE